MGYNVDVDNARFWLRTVLQQNMNYHSIET